ncbi:hypothetical protein CCR75_004756 [Bremia lactucae]|uniref:UFSP1/2/DUB catalytic domain-containing protein n=1 Tax=Bremia lactucae TaxID=4779 RepID=A0A976FLJ9_BRELC|nr:hypothetical protein CCR75_004756 [Bremia lactucae]
MQGFFPRPLLRSLQRFAQSNADATSDTCSRNSVVTRGALLGTERDVRTNLDETSITQQVAIWGLTCLSPEDANSHPIRHSLPGGISRIGYFMIVQKDANYLGSETIALQAVSDPNVDTKVLIYQVESHSLELFHCKHGKVSCIELQVVSCLRARDFHRAIGFAFLRCAIDVHGDHNLFWQRLNKCQAATCTDEDFYVRVGFQNGKKGRRLDVINGCGKNVTSNEISSVSFKSIVEGIAPLETSKRARKEKKLKQRGRTIRSINNSSDTKSGVLSSFEYGSIVNVDLLIDLAPLKTDQLAPVLTIPASKQNQHLHAHCDALIVSPLDASLSSVLTLLRHELYEQFTDVARQFKANTTTVTTSAIVHHFPLLGAAFPLTVRSDSSSESFNDMKALESLHCAFLQRIDQPLFRVSRQCSLTQQGAWLRTSDVLINVHEGISSSNVGKPSQVAIVDGFYGYYHYLQQGTNDKGWGCAYRSLQTLASWLFLQHYTSLSYLSHEHIQQVLVEMGDKPASFQGSKDWIGSVEVGYVLDELFGVRFRTLTVSSGAHLPDVARELLYHFETHGTPVMMGGGQLAFTILGVDLNEVTGTCAFLTLDPHYTGDEDLEIIQHQSVALEGYKAIPCSWSKTTTFSKNAFYNLCLPQRPCEGV